MTEDALMRKCTAILKSCTISQDVVPGSCSGTSITSSDHAREFIGIKREENTDVTIKVEDISEPISFPAIKPKPSEVSYLSVCPSLDMLPISINA